MNKAQQYAYLKAAIESGTLERIRDIQRIVYITTLTEDMKLNYNTLSKRLLAPERFTVKDVHRVASLVGLSPSVIFERIIQETHPPPEDKVARD